MPFGEYELSPSLIGLSLLHSSHPEAFQRLLVRSSIPCYRDFNLDKCRSLGFASTPSDLTPSSGSLSLRVRVSSRLASPETATRRFIMQKARRHCACAAPTACRRKVSGSVSLPCSGCFSPFPHGTGSLSVSREYLALPDGPGGFAQDFTCPALLRMPLGGRRLRVRVSHPLWNDFPDTSPRLGPAVIAVLQPRDCIATATVWALPRSLATTGGITFCFLFLRVLRCFSSPRSPPPLGRMSALHADGLPHSGTRGSKTACVSPRLFAACRAFHRLPEPQASAVRPFLLSPARTVTCGRIPWLLF